MNKGAVKEKYDNFLLPYTQKKKRVDNTREKIDNSRWAKEIRRPLGEFLGTWALTLVACFAGGIYGISDRVVQAQPAFAIGLILTVLIYSASQISGAHFNPIVSWAFFLRGVFPIQRLIIYWIAQFSGALIAGGLAYAVLGHRGEIGANQPNHISNAEGFYVECLFTFIFVYVILNVANRAKIVGANAAIAIGFALVVCHLCTIELTGTGLNPARSLGPAAWVGGTPLHVLWIYFAGPFVGSTAAAFVTYLFSLKPPKQNEGFAKGEGKSEQHKSDKDAKKDKAEGMRQEMIAKETNGNSQEETEVSEENDGDSKESKEDSEEDNEDSKESEEDKGNSDEDTDLEKGGSTS